ncbi:hypothetical protein [Kaistia sp. UC242_56]|uniref:hypothetical protein n=1 Tax=Kaistia sp. UC242_56 TaxID=3374625 RepID=UPI0037A4ABE4
MARMDALSQSERDELEAYREAAQYDIKMSGPVFMAWDRSQLDRARRLTEASLRSTER